MSVKDICQRCSTEHKAAITIPAQSHSNLIGTKHKQKHLQKQNEQGLQAHQKTRSRLQICKWVSAAANQPNCSVPMSWLAWVALPGLGMTRQAENKWNVAVVCAAGGSWGEDQPMPTFIRCAQIKTY